MAVVDRLLAVVVALALLGFGGLVTVEVVHAALGTGDLLLPWQGAAHFGRRHTWASNPVRIISAAVAAVGLLLLAIELRRRRPGTYAVTTAGGDVVAGATFRAMRGALSARAAEVDGVAEARTRLRRRSARVTVTTQLAEPGDLAERVTAHLRGWLDGLDLLRPPRIAVRVNRGGQ